MPSGDLRPVLRVFAAAIALLGALAIALVLVGQPGSASAGSVGLPNPAPASAVHYTGPRLKVLVVGDSMAGSLGVGLGKLAASYNIDLVNAGAPGCSLSMDGSFLLAYGVYPPGAPCVLDHPGQLLATWQHWVDAFRPDVVLYLARADVINQSVNGTWTWVGHRDFNTWFSTRLSAGIKVLGSKGAHVVLMTIPVSDEGLSKFPEDAPIRTARNAGLLRAAAARIPATVTVYDLAQLLTPGLTYRASVDSQAVRCADGIHFTPQAGIVVAPDLYPRLWALAGKGRITGGGSWPGGKLPPTVPTWYHQLSCA
jgi:hypothetical protein